MTIAAQTSRCRDCGSQVAEGLLLCPGCGRLVYAPELTEIARVATEAERAGDRTTALGHWRRAIDLLPPHTRQRTQIEARLSKLSAEIDGRAPGSGKGNAGKLAGGVGAVGLVLLKSKALLTVLIANGKLLLVGLLKLPTLLSMLLYARWMSSQNLVIAIGVVASIYIHEIGHVAALKRYGIEASAPMFIPGFGALVRLKQYPSDAHEDARTGLAGPLWGLAAALLAAAIGALFSQPAALFVAGYGATLNLFNLVPVWQLDGSRGLHALSRGQRVVVVAVGVAMGLAVHQWMPLVIAGVTLARTFGKDAHPTGDRAMLALFCALLGAHSLLGMLAPLDKLGF